MRTSAFATTAPLGSCTVPVIAPVAPPWANTREVKARTAKLRTTSLNKELGMIFALFSARLGNLVCVYQGVRMCTADRYDVASCLRIPCLKGKNAAPAFSHRHARYTLPKFGVEVRKA